MKRASYYFISLLIGFALAITLSQVLAAFTEPSTAPPGGNAFEPINIGSATQYKTGALGVGGVLHAYSDTVFDGNVSVAKNLSAKDLAVNNILTNGLSVGGKAVCLSDGSNCAAQGVAQSPFAGLYTTSGTCGFIPSYIDYSRGAPDIKGGYYDVTGSSCQSPNPITGSCSCPQGYSASLVSTSSAICGNWPSFVTVYTHTYQCTK